MYIKKGDTVYVRKGKDRGKTGKVLKVIKSTERILVEGLNIVKRRRKPKRRGEKGQTVEMPLSMHISNVSLLGKDGKPTRVGFRRTEKGVERVAKKGGAVI